MTHLFMGGDGGPQPYIAALPPLPSAEGGAGTSRETLCEGLDEEPRFSESSPQSTVGDLKSWEH